ncbi:MAG TPA: winged helix-turn-helix domain-containing protein [Blastocatellia bacterium]|nr:winged helix-turn-helix domain-containing protein [Blastocatellia bacterium]
MNKPSKPSYEFGPFHLDPDAGLLLRQGEPVPLTPKVFDILLALVENSGQVIEKNDLMQMIWPDTVVEENNLTVNMSALRKALGDDISEHQYIKTVPKRGYRFVANVRKLPGPSRLRQPLHHAKRQASTIKSLAILPLINDSRDADMEYLSDGITESIIYKLSQLPRLIVMARSTVFGYKGKDVEPQKVRSDLGVDAVLMGRVKQRQDQFVVGIELVNAVDGSNLWGQQYNRQLADIFVVQEEIAYQVSERLRTKLTGEEKRRLAKLPTENLEAYHLYLKGRYYWNKYTEEGFKKGIEYFSQAIAADPGYALAYSGLADAYYSSLYLPPREAMTRAKQAALKSLSLDDTLAEAHASVALVTAFYDWDWQSAEQEFKRAIALNPGLAIPHKEYGWYLLPMGRFEDSLRELRQAQQVDPLHLLINLDLGLPYHFSRRYDLAIEQFGKTIDLEPNFWPAHFFLGQAYEQQGKMAEAMSAYQMATRLDEGPWPRAGLGHLYAVLQRRDEAHAIIDELDEMSKQHYVSPYTKAIVYAGLGDKEMAFNALDEAYRERDQWLAWIKVDPLVDPLRNDPRFEGLLRRVGLK